jgi:hypothetical protein
MRSEQSYFRVQIKQNGDAGNDFWSFVMQLDLVWSAMKSPLLKCLPSLVGCFLTLIPTQVACHQGFDHKELAESRHPLY